MSMKLIKKNLSKVIKASAVGCSLFFASHALGQTYWTGGGGDGKWSTGANWSGGTVPASDGVVQFTNAAPLAVSVETSTTVQEIHTAGVGDVTIDIASGIKLSVANGGATGIWASSADITVNGPGKLALSWGNGGSTDLLDIGAAQGRTLALNAEVVGIESDLSTGIEAYIGNQPNNGTLVMGYSLNAFTGAITRTTGQVLVVPTLAPAGFPSSVGTGNAFYMNQRGTLRYTGTGDSTDRNIHLAGNNGGQLDHSGTGPLVFSGGMSNTQNSAQDLILLGDSASDATISGNIANGVGTLAIRKEGSGTWILSGNNTFSGNITVNGGTLAFDSQLALGHASQIIMTSGATLALNPSGVAGFTKTLPVVNVNGGTLSIGGSSSTVTLDGLTGHDLDVVAAPGNTIFIVGFPMGLTPVWLTLNGGPAEYDGTFGLIPASVINTVPGFKTKDETLPNDAAVKAVIDTVGTGDPIALTANPNALYGITLTADGDAVVDTAGKTLNAGLIANASATNALTIGVAPKDGLLQPKTSSFAIPSSAAISNLNPVIWYDPSDASTVTLSGNTVTGLQNKGSSGSTMNAVVRSGFSAPLYATGTASDSVLPMVKVAANSQGLQSASNTGITGNNPRTLIAVMSRAETTLGFEVSFGNPSTAQWFALMHRDSNGNTRFSIFGTDLDMPRPENNVPVVLSILNGVGGDNSAWRGFQNKIPTGEVSGTIATADTVLSMGHRSNGSQTSQRGQVGEVLLFDKSLTDSERETVENYLLAKWQPMAPALALRSGADAPVIVNAAITEPSDRAVSLIKSGPGDVTLAGSATLSGPVLISDGNLILDIPNGTTDTLSGVTRGTGKLVKTGDGILIRPNNVANTYSGGTDILGGILRVGNNASLGAGPLTVANGGTLDLGAGSGNDSFTISTPVFLSGTGVNGLGAVINTGSRQYNGIRNTTVTLADNAAIGGNGANRWDIRDSTIDLNNHILTKVGSGDTRLSGNPKILNAPLGTVFDIQQGNLGIEGAATASPNTPDRKIIIHDGASFGMYGVSVPLNWSFITGIDSTISCYGNDNSDVYRTDRNVLNGDIMLNGTLNLAVSANYHFKTLAGKISGDGGITVNGGGLTTYHILANPDNDFTGPVQVTNGSLGLYYPGSFPGGVAAIASKLSIANSSSAGVRVIAGGNRWTGSEIAAVANSGRFTSGAQRFGIIVGQGEEASLGNLTTAFDCEIDFYGPGTLALDGNVGPITRYTRAWGGTLVFTNNATYNAAQNVTFKEGNDWDNVNRDVNIIVGGDAKITLTDKGYNQSSPMLNVGYGAGKAILDLKDNAYIQTRLQVGQNNTASHGAIYQSGGTFLSSGGSGSDTIIGNSGYGYYQLDNGDFIMKGFTYLGGQGNATSVGIIRQTGGTIAFNGMRYLLPASNVVGDSYGGRLDLSRNGKAILHLEGGTFEHYGPLAIIGNGNANNAAVAATMTVTGTADAFVDRAIDMGAGTAGNVGTASLNLNGGTLTVPSIQRRNYTGARANVNFNGGLLRVTDGGAGLFVRESNTAAAFNAYVYSGGARIEVPEGLSRTVDIPLERPAGYGVSAINFSNGGSGYIAPPYVNITGGGGNGATAIASINRTTGQVTGIEITSPGTGYTSAPTVAFIGGGGTAPSNPTAVLATNISGGLTKTGGGTLILNAPSTYRGDTVVEEGVLLLTHPEAIHPGSPIIIGDGTLDLGGNTVTNASITVTGTGGVINGKLITSSAVKEGPGTATWDAAVEFDTIETAAAPGLWEGARLSGAFNLTDPNSCASVEFTTTAANGVASSGGIINGKQWPNNSTYIYSGYIWNRNGTNETWTFAKSFDDSIYLAIDGTEYINHTKHDEVFKTNVVVTPGAHPIEIRFGQATGGVGAMKQTTAGNEWWTSDTIALGVDYLGRDENVMENYASLDADDGYRLTLTGPTIPDSGIRVLEGTLDLPSEIPAPGLYEGRLSGYPNLSAPNPNDGVEFTTTAANGSASANGNINGKPWPNNTTYVYTGYIWNRNGTNETWTFAKSFDDQIVMTIDGTVYMNHDTYNEVILTNVVITAGAHPIEIRFGQGSGGVGGVDQTSSAYVGSRWWRSAAFGFGVDYLGRGETVRANYAPLNADGGKRLTLTASGYKPAQFADGVQVDLYTSMDLGNTSRPDVIISPAGDVNVGIAQVSGTGNNALNGVTYLVTVHGSESDTIAFTDSGPIDLTGLTIKPSDLTSETLTGTKHVIATAPGGFIGKPILDGFDPKWTIARSGNEMWLFIPSTILMIR